MDIILLKAGEPLPMFQLGVASIAAVVILMILKAVNKKALSTDDGNGPNNTWATLAKVVRVVYALSLLYLLYVIFNWMFL